MTLIYEGTLKDNTSYEVRRLTNKNLAAILSLQDIVYKAIENKDQLACLTQKDYEYILHGKGLILGVFVHGQLVALRALLVPQVNDPEHLGLDVGLDKERLDQVIYQEISLVHPKFQGNRLQQQLAKWVMTKLDEKEHNYRYVCATVDPSNIPSLLDKFRQGMHVKALKLKYDHQLRYIFLKDLQEDLSKKVFKEKYKLSIDQITKQQQLLAKGWLGLSLEKCDNSYVIVYGKL